MKVKIYHTQDTVKSRQTEDNKRLRRSNNLFPKVLTVKCVKTLLKYARTKVLPNSIKNGVKAWMISWLKKKP